MDFCFARFFNVIAPPPSPLSADVVRRKYNARMPVLDWYFVNNVAYQSCISCSPEDMSGLQCEGMASEAARWLLGVAPVIPCGFLETSGKSWPNNLS